MNFNHKDGVNFDCARVRFVSRKCISRLTHLNMHAGKREISPLAERVALRALNRALALPEGANYYI